MDAAVSLQFTPVTSHFRDCKSAADHVRYSTYPELNLYLLALAITVPPFKK